MGSSTNLSAAAPSPEFIKRFLTLANSDGVLSFDAFMRLALYDDKLGYYRQPHQRVGYEPGTDFFTATSTGPLFGELMACAGAQLLGAAQAAECTFVEIGVEPTGGILHQVAHHFKSARTIPMGAPLDLNGNCVIFSNELFDAQPCRRFTYRAGHWRELGVACREGNLSETVMPPGDLPDYLPAKATEGYCVDAPEAATQLLDEIARQPWQGLFIACDYGKTWPELIHETPQGTVRAYFRHTQSNDLLAHPGAQDLTCHVCWDWLVQILRQHHFQDPGLQSQEAFLIHHAAPLLAEIAATEAGHLSDRKLGLMQLLHPAHLGQKFQVLHARRQFT
ncbi:MAG: SAM-dependent methyltransferase [Cephaloticoccus sp.]|nr:SAM-dependent methyltransferase [Cephaloticoccus sp.]MCF7759764.1 SAM-dependent methyltransferase [Cephaloticoccus sp.]